jgi:hypothetical protein
MSSDDDEQYDPDVDKIEPSIPPKPFIEIFSTHPNFGTDIFRKEGKDIDTTSDEQLEAQGVKISSETYFLASDKRIIKR